MLKTKRQRVVRGIALGLGTGLLIFVLHLAGLFETLEWKTWDWRLRALTHPREASQRIVILLVDQQSLDFYEGEGLGWPWPRQLYAAAVQFCQRGGATVAVFDVLFTESSVYGLEDDLSFGQAMADADNVVLAAFFSEKEATHVDTAGDEILQGHALQLPGLSPHQIQSRKSVTLSVEEILSAAQSVGNVRFAPDGDGIFRRLPLVFSYQGRLYPALPLAAVQQILEQSPRVDDDGTLTLADRRIPLDAGGRLIIRYHGGVGTYQSISMADVIQSQLQLEEGQPPQISPQFFQDKIVLVGFSAPGLLDLRPTPFSSVYPGVEVNATVIDNLLAGDFVALASGLLSALLILLSSLGTGLAVSLPKQIWQMVLWFLVCLVLTVLVCVWAFWDDLWMPLVAPLAGTAICFATGSVFNYALEGRQKRFVKKVFQHYLSHQVIEEIIKDPSKLRLGGQRRQMSVFFSDVAGFTSLAESLSPEDLTELLNLYLSEMTEIIFDHGGTVDKYIGDAIVAFWNAPLDQPDHAQRACLAALDCQSRLAELREEVRQKSGRELAMRIGLNTGPMVVGNMGSRERFDYSVLGDAVNLGARLEGACKQYGIWILASEATYQEAQGVVEGREVDLIRVVGKKEPVRIYELLARQDQLSPERRQESLHFAEGLRLYRNRNWAEAMQIFTSLPTDPVARVFLERCRSYQSSPPPGGWDGVWELSKK